MIYWILTVLVIILALIVAFGLAFPWLLYGFGRPQSREEAVLNGRELVKNTRRVVAVAAHPDDLECDIGGTLAKLSKNGAEVIAVISADNSNRQGTRRKEELAAAEALGYKKVIFLDYKDGALEDVPKDELNEKLISIFQQYKPDTVFAFDPKYENFIYKHSDHKASGEAAIRAVRQAKIPHVYLYFSSRPNAWVDISETIDQKIEGWLSFKSQQIVFPPFASRYFFATSAKAVGSKVGYKYAEAFRKIR